MKTPRIRRRGWWWKKPSSCFLSSGSEERNLIFRFFLKFDPDKWCISFKKMKTSPTHHQKRGGERLWTISGRFGRGSFGEGLDEISLWCRDEDEEEMKKKKKDMSILNYYDSFPSSSSPPKTHQHFILYLSAIQRSYYPLLRLLIEWNLNIHHPVLSSPLPIQSLLSVWLPRVKWTKAC